MVKRVKRRAVKRSSRKKVSVKRTSEKRLREDFEVFAKGVERLEALRKELNSLDTHGFESDAAKIRGKLKNVSYIPTIEKEMRVLKSKIRGSYREKPARESSAAHVRIHKKIDALEKALKKRERIARKVGRLESDVAAAARKKPLSSHDKKLVNDIPKMESQLRALKSYVESQKDEEKRKKQLLKTIDPGVSFVIDNSFDMSLNDIKATLSAQVRKRELMIQKQLHDDLEERKNAFAQQYHAVLDRFEKQYKDRVTTSLDREVKKRFNDAVENRIRAIKGNLTKAAEARFAAKREAFDRERVKKLASLEKEKETLKKNMRVSLEKEIGRKVRKQLTKEEHMILATRKKELQEQFAQRHRGITERERAVRSQLTEKGNALQQLLNDEKKKIVALRLSRRQLSHVKEKLNSEFSQRQAMLEKEHAERIEREKEKLAAHMHDQLIAHQAALDSQMHEKMTGKVQALHMSYEEKKRAAEQMVADMKERLANEKSLLSKIRNRLSATAQKIRADDVAYKHSLHEKLEREKQDAIKKEVRVRSADIKKQLRREYEQRLRLELKVKEAAFEKRKADLTLDIQKKAKELFR